MNEPLSTNPSVSVVDPYTGEPRQKVFSLRAIGLTSVLGSFIPALILYGINWKRLGDAHKANIAFIMAITAMVLIIGEAVAEMVYAFEIPTNVFRGFMQVLNWGFIYYFFKTQDPALEAYHATTPYLSGWWAVLAILIWTIAFFALMFLITFIGLLVTGGL